jgi:hypothetical protein
MFTLIASTSPAIALAPIAVVCLAFGCAAGYSLLPEGRRLGIAALLVVVVIGVFVVQNSFSRYEYCLKMIRSAERAIASHSSADANSENAPEHLHGL